jgi:membrane associated rhomboid family serine protease
LRLDAPPGLQQFLLWNGSPSAAAINLAYSRQGPIVAVVDHEHGLNQPGDSGQSSDVFDDSENPSGDGQPGNSGAVAGDGAAGEGAAGAVGPAAAPAMTRDAAEAASSRAAIDYANNKDSMAGTVPDGRLPVAAYEALPDSEKLFPHFAWFQTISNVFLHGGLMHLVGNMIFFFVFGSRINALLGQLQTLGVYLLLGVVASLSYHLSMAGHHPQTPALGASGAIMGMAGMYLIFFPINKVYMIFWIRLGPLTLWRRIMKIFALRGFWVLLFYIAFDVVDVAMGVNDHTAHWAHVGGFLGGIAVGLILLCSRLVDGHGGDILSVTLGKHAWAILGNPAARRGAAVAAA